MSRSIARCATLTALVLGGLCVALALADDTKSAGADERQPPPKAPPTPVKPAILVIKAWDAPRAADAAPRMEVLEPAGWRLPRQRTDRSDPDTTPRRRPHGAAPDFGAGYTLRRSWSPDPWHPEMHYYFYDVDLGHPNIAKQWRELRRAQFKEMRREREILRGDRQWKRRGRKLIEANRQATYDGQALLQAGAYRSAVITLTRAAEYNHGDARSRLHLAQARMALGHDREAAQALRRALELKPKMVPAQLQLAQYYPSEQEFDAQVDALAKRLATRENTSAEEYFLLGFMEFQRSNWGAAHAAFRRAAAGLPNDERVQTYLSLSKPAER